MKFSAIVLLVLVAIGKTSAAAISPMGNCLQKCATECQAYTACARSHCAICAGNNIITIFY